MLPKKVGQLNQQTFSCFYKKNVFKNINPIRNNTKYWKFNAEVRSLKFI